MTNNIIKITKERWQPFYKEELTDQDVTEINNSIKELAKLAIRWDKEQGCKLNNKEISIKEASKITGIKYQTLYKWIITDGKIPYRDYHPLKMVKRSDVEAFMQSHLVTR